MSTADQLLAERKDLIEQKQRTDKLLRQVRECAQSASRRGSRAWSAEADMKKLGAHSQEIQNRLAVIKIEIRKKRESEFERCFVAAAKVMLSSGVFESIVETANDMMDDPAIDE